VTELLKFEKDDRKGEREAWQTEGGSGKMGEGKARRL